jgi:hypothetical protein
MPAISRFFGIVIAMYYNDHDPPHFHARYGDQKAIFRIEEVEVLDGRLSPRAERLVKEWAHLHKSELMANWQLARRLEPLQQISPLE